jgi:hypothetical protein
MLKMTDRAGRMKGNVTARSGNYPEIETDGKDAVMAFSEKAAESEYAQISVCRNGRFYRVTLSTAVEPEMPPT